MLIRAYRPGDEEGQVRVYNAATAGLPGFKPATAAEVARRYRGSDPDPETKFYAVEGESDEMVAYAVYNPNGRVSYPWCLPGHEAARAPVLETMLEAMRQRGFPTAWAAYRGDWTPALEFLREHGFRQSREMINYIAETDRLPQVPPPWGMVVSCVLPEDLPRLIELGRGLFRDAPERLESFYWKNPYFSHRALFSVRPIGGGPIEGAGLVVIGTGFADSTKIDPAMPCFRMGAMGTESERLKRINGVVALVFRDDAVGTSLLAEAARRLAEAGITHAASQVPSDHPELVSFHDWFFQRQGAFPILTRRLTRP